MGRDRKKKTQNGYYILNINCKTVRLLEENIGEHLCDIEFGNDILDMTPRSLYMEEIFN